MSGNLAWGFLMDDHPDSACTSREVDSWAQKLPVTRRLVWRKLFFKLSWNNFSHYLETQENLELKEIFKCTSLFYEWRIWGSGRQGKALFFVVLHRIGSSPAIQCYQPACFPVLLDPAPQPLLPTHSVCPCFITPITHLCICRFVMPRTKFDYCDLV